MYQNTANFASEIHQKIIKGTHDENRAVVNTFVSQVVDNDKLSLQENGIKFPLNLIMQI